MLMWKAVFRLRGLVFKGALSVVVLSVLVMLSTGVFVASRSSCVGSREVLGRATASQIAAKQESETIWCHFPQVVIRPGGVSRSGLPKPRLVGHLIGSGEVREVFFAANYYGVAFAYQVDGGPIRWGYNADCLNQAQHIAGRAPNSEAYITNMIRFNPLNGYASLIGMTYIPQVPISFSRSFKLYFGTSSRRNDNKVWSVHLVVKEFVPYSSNSGLIAGKGNILQCNAR